MGLWPVLFLIVNIDNMALIYKQVVSAVGRMVPRKMQPFWNHPAGRLRCSGLELETGRDPGLL